MPIVVGGTGFYLRWYVHGRPQTPASSPESAQRVQELLTQVSQQYDQNHSHPIRYPERT